MNHSHAKNDVLDDAAIEGKLRALADQLGIAQNRLDAAITAGIEGGLNAPSLDGAATELRAARTALDDIKQHLPHVEPPPKMRACPACARSIRLAATLCGYCWTKSTAV